MSASTSGPSSAGCAAACVKLADGLFLAVHKDRTSSRRTRFFDRAVSRFVRMALPTQVNKVKGWLTGGPDAELDRQRPELTQWSEVDDLPDRP